MGTVYAVCMYAVLAALALWLVAGAQTHAQTHAQAKPDAKFPDVIAVKVTPRGDDRFDFDVTISSTYDTPQRYADAFRILAPDGAVLGERVLLHDHADEQPFTRDLYGLKLPRGLRGVTVQGRDLKHGYGGKTMDVAIPGR